MAASTHRTLKRRGRVSLVEDCNPAMGTGYSVRSGSLGFWRGHDLGEAEEYFERAVLEIHGLDRSARPD